MRTSRLTNTPVTLYVAQVERAPGADAPEVTALHGVHKGRAWRLTMADAVLAFKSGRYIFYVEHGGERRKLVVSSSGRLEAASRGEGDLLLQLPPATQPLAEA
jgi:hypothetical protein